MTFLRSALLLSEGRISPVHSCRRHPLRDLLRQLDGREGDETSRDGDNSSRGGPEDRQRDDRRGDEDRRTRDSRRAEEREREQSREEREGPEREEDERTREDRQSVRGEGIKKIYGGIWFSYRHLACYPRLKIAFLTCQF